MTAIISTGNKTFPIGSLPRVKNSTGLIGRGMTGLNNNTNTNKTQMYYNSKLDNILLSEKASLYESGMVRDARWGTPRSITTEPLKETPFAFLYKLEKSGLIKKEGNRGVNFGKVISFSAIEKNKYNLLEFQTIHSGLSTDDISQIKKYNISPIQVKQ